MNAADRRAAILDAALDAFAAGGYHETSLDTVAARAGISKALIYEHFASKRELHGALMETYVHELLGRVAEATAAAEPGEERLRFGADAFLRFVEERPGAWRMLVRNVADSEIFAWQDRLIEEVAEAITEMMVADARAEGVDEPYLERSIEMLSQQLVGAVRSLANWWDDHRDVPRERVLEALMDFAWLGMDRVSSGERWMAPGR
jgi:AcrR family transcriptional regulator